MFQNGRYYTIEVTIIWHFYFGIASQVVVITITNKTKKLYELVDPRTGSPGGGHIPEFISFEFR